MVANGLVRRPQAIWPMRSAPATEWPTTAPRFGSARRAGHVAKSSASVTTAASLVLFSALLLVAARTRLSAAPNAVVGHGSPSRACETSVALTK